MSDIQIIESVLENTARRRRWQRAWRGAWFGLFLGAMAWLVALLCFKFLPVSVAILPRAGLLAAGLVLGAFALGWLRRDSLPQTARWVDGQQKLQERLSTALEVASLDAPATWRDLVVVDAARCVARIDPKALLPYHLPRITRGALLVLFLCAGLGFVPEYRSQAYLQKQRESEVIRDTGRQLAELTRRTLEHRPPALEPTRQALDSVAELGDQLAKAQLTRNEALKDLANVAEKLKEQTKDLGKNPAFKSLERAARNSNRGGTPGSAELQKQIEALQKALGNQAGDKDALEKLKKEIQKARAAAAGLPDKNSAAGDAARDQLSQTLADLAKQSADMGVPLPSLEEAIAALAASQTDQLLRDLDLAETDLDKLQEMAKALEKLQMQAEKLGKDLGEQLAKGQLEAAQSTLEKLAARLRSAQLEAAPLQKILDEVTRAVPPSAPFGKVPDLLKQAIGQMQSGQNEPAAQSLVEAAKELESLLRQLDDAKGLMASLKALQRAQMSIGNCQGWGQCQGPPRAGKGGKPGSGVGTWADQDLWLDLADMQQKWDNSGVDRPDQDPRGLTDRGEGQMPDGLEATKIKGQLNPGGPMPSITLKGVSIKGMSKVDFKEIATTAQSEAQSALSQEQVPRAYQGAVRDYFDDLKK